MEQERKIGMERGRRVKERKKGEKKKFAEIKRESAETEREGKKRHSTMSGRQAPAMVPSSKKKKVTRSLCGLTCLRERGKQTEGGMAKREWSCKSQYEESGLKKKSAQQNGTHKYLKSTILLVFNALTCFFVCLSFSHDQKKRSGSPIIYSP